MASPKHNTTQPFAEERDRLFTELKQQSIALRCSPTHYLEIAEMLDELARQISSIKVDNNTPRCFSIKCNALTITLQNHSELLKSHPSRFVQVADAIDLMQLQLGRLTVKADGDDDFAQKMDVLTARMETSWVPTDEMDGNEARIKEHLRKIWRELNIRVVDCGCDQCQDQDEKRLVVESTG